MADGLVAKDASDVGPDHQAGDGDVPAEENVRHLDNSNIGPSKRIDQRRQHGRPVTASENSDRRSGSG